MQLWSLSVLYCTCTTIHLKMFGPKTMESETGDILFRPVKKKVKKRGVREREREREGDEMMKYSTLLTYRIAKFNECIPQPCLHLTLDES